MSVLILALVVPYEEMVLKASEEPDSPEIAQLVRAELINVIHAEQKGLSDVFASGITQYVDLSSKNYTYLPSESSHLSGSLKAVF